MEPGAYAPKQRLPSCLRHTHQVSAIKTSGHLMTHSTSRQEGLGVRLRFSCREQAINRLIWRESRPNWSTECPTGPFEIRFGT